MGSSVSVLPPSSNAVVTQLTDEFRRLQESASQTREEPKVRKSPAAATSAAPEITAPLHLTLEQLLVFQFPSHVPISFMSLPTIYALDVAGGGRITLPMIVDFFAWCENKCAEWTRSERAAKLEGLFALKMWHDGSRLGEAHLVNWFCRLVSSQQNETITRHQFTYVHRDSIQAAFQLFRPHFPSELSFQEWFDQLQHIAETHSMLDLEDDTLDDYLPIQAFALFTSYFLTGFFGLFSALGLQSRAAAPVIPASGNNRFNSQDHVSLRFT